MTFFILKKLNKKDMQENTIFIKKCVITYVLWNNIKQCIITIKKFLNNVYIYLFLFTNLCLNLPSYKLIFPFMNLQNQIPLQ